MKCCHQSLPRTFLLLTPGQCCSVGAFLWAIALRLRKAPNLICALDGEIQAKDQGLWEFNLSVDFKEVGICSLVQAESITSIWNNIVHLKIGNVEWLLRNTAWWGSLMRTVNEFRFLFSGSKLGALNPSGRIYLFPAIIKTLRFNSLNHVCTCSEQMAGTIPWGTEQQLQIANAHPQLSVQQQWHLTFWEESAWRQNKTP